MTLEPTAHPTTMEQYRKTLIPTQLMVFALCITVRLVGGADWVMVGVMFVALQVFSFVGAMWAASLARRIHNKREQLPLATKRRR